MPNDGTEMTETTSNPQISTKRTPLFDLHVELGGRMVPFAGYEMPVQFDGIIAEHTHTRSAAGLFDVSHMGQRVLTGPGHATTAAALEAMTPGDFSALKPGRMRYTLLLTGDGTVIDDLMVSRSADPQDDGKLYLVVNAARKDVDDAHIAADLPSGAQLQRLDDRALLALQGPKAVDALARHCRPAPELSFMAVADAEFDGLACTVSRSGYTGEDGFEISVAAGDAETVARALLAEPEVKPIGLGARDTLRLEAGLCLYGHDIDETTTPGEADLLFALSKRRREEGGFPGAERILREIARGVPRKRVGLALNGRAPAREGAEIVKDGAVVGAVTSGGFGPTAGRPVAMGYVATEHGAIGTELDLMVRGRALTAHVAEMPFVPQRYYRKPKA